MNIRTLLRFYSFLLVIALTSLYACSDNDDDTGGNSSTERTLTTQQAEQRIALAAVLSHLTGETFNEATDINFEDRTYDATIGVIRNQSRPSERSIQVRSAQLAEGFFRSLTDGISSVVKETADGCIIDLSDLDCHSQGRRQHLGTLTFHRDGTGDNVGYADVDIACIPGLQRISYKTKDQWGDNGSFRSPIGYGEIFTGHGLYWICVREAYGDHSELAGVLINIQPGKSSSWRPYLDKLESDDDDYWGAWAPTDFILPERYGSAILEYIDICGNDSYAREKKEILRHDYGTKVFPAGYVWEQRATDGLWVLNGINGPGFASTQYYHEGTAYGNERGVIIVRDAYEGNYRWFHGWWRCWSIYCTPVDCSNPKDPDPDDCILAKDQTQITNLRSVNQYVYCYTDRDDFFHFANYSIVYTVRGITFTTEIPNGLTRVDTQIMR